MLPALSEQLAAAHPRAPDWKSAGRVVLPRGVYEITEPLHLPGGAHLIGDGRVEIIATAPLPAMLYAQADLVGNYYGSYLGRVENITLNGNALADVGLQTGMIASYVFEQLRAINCLDAGADLSQIQNSKFDTCAFEHNGQGGGPLSCGLRLSDAAASNRFVGCEIGQNWGWQIVVHDQRKTTADGAMSPSSDAPAGQAGPSQNEFLGCMLEEYSGRSRGILYGRAGEAIRFDLCDLSHIGTGPVDMVRLTSEDAPMPNPTSGWLFRDCKFHGNGNGYVGVRATGTWDVVLRGTRWVSIETRVIKDRAGAVRIAE